MTAACPAFAQGAAIRGPGPGVAMGMPRAAIRPGIMTGIQPNRGVLPNVRSGIDPGVRPGVSAGVPPNRGVLPGVRSGLDLRGRPIGALRGGYGRFGRYPGRGYGYGGVDGLGLGLGLAGNLVAPPYYDPDYDPSGPDAGFGPAEAPPRCAPPPQIIKVGHGLRHPAHTRVVYGAPSACVP